MDQHVTFIQPTIPYDFTSRLFWQFLCILHSISKCSFSFGCLNLASIRLCIVAEKSNQRLCLIFCYVGIGIKDPEVMRLKIDLKVVDS